MSKTPLYSTRDGEGNEIIKEVEIKQFKVYDCNFVCPICHKEHNQGCKIKDVVSGAFTDWQYVSDYVCQSCSELFSLYFYNYISGPDGIRLYNVRELREQLITPQNPPFLCVITTSRKKHLFYRARWNHTSNPFAVNLEDETIMTSCRRMQVLFDFVDSLQTLGASKSALKDGEIPFSIIQKVGFNPLKWLKQELQTSREIQIPLYCGQKREITEEEAICCINSIVQA